MGEHQVMVGTSAGKMGLWDFRVGQGYKGLVRKYGGCVGAVRDIATSQGNQYFCAVSLDRFLRVWRVGQGGKIPTHKMYLKSRLNCVLMNDNFDPDKEQDEEKDSKPENIEIKNEDDSVDSNNANCPPKEEAEDDELWDNMIVINSKRKKGDGKLQRKKVK